MKALFVFVFLGALGITACDSGPRPEPLVVYVHGTEAPDLAKRFAEFTQASGIPVTIRHDDSATITNDVIAKRGSPPADILLTSNVADIWRAAEEGALRPIQSPALDDVPRFGRDPDGFWVAFDVYFAVIGQANPDQASVVKDYAGLANPKLKGKVCLSSATLPINRAVIASLIADRGVRNAELIVRGWIQNLGQPPFATEAELIAAIESGNCIYGVFSSSFESGDIRRQAAEPYYYNIEGLGVTRHARNPESAQALVNWALTTTAPTYGDVAQNVWQVGRLDEDARLLAERARYR